MNTGLALFVALTAFLGTATCAPSEEKFTTKYDNVNLDEILRNERLFKKYLECLLADNDSHCTADGKELRKAIPDALVNECAKCSDRQKEGSEKVIKHLRDNRPQDWEKLQAKWDPEGIYNKRYAERLSS
ncbi:Ejaculatory bulb-specific protein 3 [Gryllus bimaculatus]|nr:Ejaculatory bulb-specific protein 3 [Gryllus bimaculatus]